MAEPTITPWRPVGPEERALIRKSDMRALPPRLPEQPIFYPVTSDDYAIKIARDWNVRASGSGYVSRCSVRKSCLDRHRVETAGGRAQQKYGISAEGPENVSAAIVGEIGITREYRAEGEI